MGPRVPVRLAFSLLPLTLLLLSVPPAARASNPDSEQFDAATLIGMEARAAAAEPRDQCFLYTEILHGWTELAGRDMLAGDDSGTVQAVQHADADATRLKQVINRNSKRLKNAELLLDHSVHRLSDMLRVSTMDEHDKMQAVLKHVSSVHDVLLAAVFSH